MRSTRITAGVIAALAMHGAPAQAASGDPYVVYTANRQVGGSVVLRADPTTGAVSEVSRNGAQGRYFVHPYDLAVERDGNLLVVDMGAFAVDPRQRVADGAVIRVDPASGRQSLVSRGGALVDPAGNGLHHFGVHAMTRQEQGNVRARLLAVPGLGSPCIDLQHRHTTGPL